MSRISLIILLFLLSFLLAQEHYGKYPLAKHKFARSVAVQSPRFHNWTRFIPRKIRNLSRKIGGKNIKKKNDIDFNLVARLFKHILIVIELLLLLGGKYFPQGVNIAADIKTFRSMLSEIYKVVEIFTDVKINDDEECKKVEDDDSDDDDDDSDDDDDDSDDDDSYYDDSDDDD